MVIAEKKMERLPMSKSRRSKKSKRVSVSSKRQISIPKEFYDQLNIGEEVTIELHGNHLLLKPIRENFDDFSEEILGDLIAEGYTGEDLMMEFKHRKAQIADAVESLIEDTLKNGKKTSFDELFGDEDEDI
ncbi:AbrB/MazE/SpoVT family DNA-binding domain-containing protein [Bacillota bacterium Lsc_1132]